MSIVVNKIASYVSDLTSTVINRPTIGIGTTRRIVAYEIACYISDCSVRSVNNRAAIDSIVTINIRIVADKIACYVSDFTRIIYCTSIGIRRRRKRRRSIIINKIAGYVSDCSIVTNRPAIVRRIIRRRSIVINKIAGYVSDCTIAIVMNRPASGLIIS